MPRLKPSLLRKAHAIHPNLRTLLPTCRDLSSARHELRWIREHVASRAPRAPSVSSPAADARRRVADLCRRRGRGVPLQYLLGTQPFGPLELLCRPGVLIPRADTEGYTVHLASRLGRAVARQQQPKEPLRILDLCTGTGCVALTLYALLHRQRAAKESHLVVAGVDLSGKAIKLFRKNLQRAMDEGHIDSAPAAPRSQTSQGGPEGVHFLQADIFDNAFLDRLPAAQWDVLVSNPPYVSRDVWARGDREQMGHSVRKYEPLLALVPRSGLRDRLLLRSDEDEGETVAVRDEDVFYRRLLDVAALAGSHTILLEVGDHEQAVRVAVMAARHPHTAAGVIELWRDSPDASAVDVSEQEFSLSVCDNSTASNRHRVVPIRGHGNIRSVFISLASSQPAKHLVN